MLEHSCKRDKLVCAQCGREFEVYRSRRNAGRKFCSKECYYKSLYVTRIDDLSSTKACSGCGEEKPLSDFHRRGRNKSTGRKSLCKDCETKRVMGYYYKKSAEISKHNSDYARQDRQVNPEKYTERRLLESKKLWERAISFFGPCACCGESRREFLSIDHINGHGNEFRKSSKGRSKTGIYLLRQFNAANWPEELKTEYRLLCMNCNFAIGHDGHCPHHPEIQYTYYNASLKKWVTPTPR
jgi:hypothetical protein